MINGNDFISICPSLKKGLCLSRIRCLLPLLYELSKGHQNSDFFSFVIGSFPNILRKVTLQYLGELLVVSDVPHEEIGEFFDF